MLIEIAFWASLLFIMYVYVLYPVIIRFFSYLFGSFEQPEFLADDELPFVSLVVAAYNEESVIQDRILNALDLDYPTNKLEIIIATDGCTDNTNTIANQYAEDGVRVLQYHPRRGKPSVVNDTIAQANGEIIVMSDANTMMQEDAIKTLVRWFKDPAIGTVCGCLKLVDPVSNKNADGLYWKYENNIKESEGKLRALLGANGAIYAIRKDIVPKIPADTMIDDFTIPLLAKMNTGKGIVYDQKALAHEESSPSVTAEFGRRVRIATGGVQATFRLKGLFNPIYGWTFFSFLSHKIMRWASPIFLLTALITNTLLLPKELYLYTFCAQTLFYSFCIVGSLLNLSGILGRVMRIANLFLYVNVAVFIGTIKWFVKHQSGMWDRTARSTQ